MPITERGKIQSGAVVLEKPIRLAEGTEVIVHVETLDQAPETSDTGENSSSLPLFGMWADREDLGDSAEWVRKEREQWHRRHQSRD